jgi:two-component sensor histidine kinase
MDVVNPQQTVARPPGPLNAIRLRVVRVAIALGWISVGVVIAGSLLPPPSAPQPAVWALVSSAAAANLVLARLPWARLVPHRIGEAILTTWAAALVLLVATLTYAGGGWTSEFWLLYFLVIPFIAITEPRRQQAALGALVLVVYLAAVVLAPVPVPPSGLAVRLGVLSGAFVMAGVIAQILIDNALSRAEAESEARIERVLADEAHHRIKNNLQLVADLLTLEAGKAGSELDLVVDTTVSRIQSVAAVHQSLARRGEGRVTLLPVIERIVSLLAERLAEGRCVRVRGDDVELPSDQATWTALVVGELVTNALRHGRGTVDVTVVGNDGRLELDIADQGNGPDGDGQGLGSALVHRLVEEGMRGTIQTRRSAGGWEVHIVIPLSEEMADARAHR